MVGIRIIAEIMKAIMRLVLLSLILLKIETKLISFDRENSFFIDFQGGGKIVSKTNCYNDKKN